MVDMLFLHNKIKELGVPFVGVSDLEEGQTSRRVDFLPEATPSQITQAQSMADGFNTLVVSATKTTIADDDVDTADITAGLSSFDYALWADGEMITSGNAPDGVINFHSDVAGIYVIEIIQGDATGYVEVRVE